MKNILELIIDAAKNDDMNRVIELAEKQKDKFCDNNCVWTDHHPDCVRAEPEWYHIIDVHGCNRFYHRTEDCPYKAKTPLYTTPQQRTWVGLTDEQISNLWCEVTDTDFVTIDTHEFARAIETKLKEKNT